MFVYICVRLCLRVCVYVCVYIICVCVCVCVCCGGVKYKDNVHHRVANRSRMTYYRPPVVLFGIMRHIERTFLTSCVTNLPYIHSINSLTTKPPSLVPPSTRELLISLVPRVNQTGDILHGEDRRTRCGGGGEESGTGTC